ncbi:hypothetical protein ABVK25_000547 [Lepraria finkii]|uniref:Uncharacterized protein n=1 Tax=Lepraria finkii TaxID=1340010 RepID=A0ABR4BNA0_9LECA
MPVISRKRHSKSIQTISRSQLTPASDLRGRAFTRSTSAIGLDLHTSETSIEITDPSLTIHRSGLEDHTIDGILNLYVVQRSDNTQLAEKPGKLAIYQSSGFWELLTPQSRRGTAAFLSSLRIFINLIKTKKMEKYQQNAILRTIHGLTRFPPALLATYVLMEGKTLRVCQFAALVQCFFEVLKTIVPHELIQNDNKRMLESS